MNASAIILERRIMTFRVKIISPIRIDQADLKRRQDRYGQTAGSETQINVCNLPEGPTALLCVADMVACEHAVFQAGAGICADKWDAILVDCVFDPAVDSIQKHTGVPTFGPMRTTLSLLHLVAQNFAIVARTQTQCEMMTDVIRRYGYGSSLVATRSLDLTYAQGRQPAVFNKAMAEQIKNAVRKDRAQAILMGSTTMALNDTLLAAANGVPLVMPGMFSLRVMESMWNEGLLVRKPLRRGLARNSNR